MAFTFIDLFAGVGGLRIPFEEYGGKCVFTSEIDRYAQKTYLWNHGELPSGDITKISAQDIPNFDVLLAGFPCQPFSHAGLRKGFQDSRGTLFHEIERIIEHHKPKVVVLENVKGLLNHDKGNTLATIKSILELKLGYQVSEPKILNALDFGVPQNRQRLVIVATNPEKGVPDFRFSDRKTKFPKTLGSILEKPENISPKYVLSDLLWSSHKSRKERHQKNGNGFGYSLFDESSPYTRTISARYYKDGSEILIAHGDLNPRKLTPREAIRLQGFPEKFRIAVSDNQIYKQMGNSVAVPVFRYVAELVAKLIEPTSIREPWKPAKIESVKSVIRTLPTKEASFFEK